MCALFVDWKKIGLMAIGCCLTAMAVQTPAMGQLFQRRGNPGGQHPAAPRQADGSYEDSADANNADSQTRSSASAGSGKAQNSLPPGADRYQIPDTTDVEKLVNYLSGLLTFQPKTKEEAELYRQSAPQAMTLAAQKILQYEPDENSDNFLFAQKYLLAVDVMSVEQATPDEKIELMEIIVENLHALTWTPMTWISRLLLPKDSRCQVTNKWR